MSSYRLCESLAQGVAQELGDDPAGLGFGISPGILAISIEDSTLAVVAVQLG
jgi:hypothetical protein